MCLGVRIEAAQEFAMEPVLALGRGDDDCATGEIGKRRLNSISPGSSAIIAASSSMTQVKASPRIESGLSIE
jgi:hypothetical protein